MTYTLQAHSARKPAASRFGREMVKALHARGIPRTELHRATGIGRTALDNYRTGSSLPRTEVAAQIAAVLEWPLLLEIVRKARTKPCERCRHPFSYEAGSGVKRYCSNACLRLAAEERLASSRIRKAGQTDDRRQTQAAIQRLRSGIRIAEERTIELAEAIDTMCHDCEPMGVCHQVLCPLRAFSPLPLEQHRADEPRTNAEVRADLNRKAAPARAAAMRRRHAEGTVRYLPKGDPRHPANDPERRAAFVAAISAGRRRKAVAMA